MARTRISFRTFSHRRIETPLDKRQGFKNYVAVVEISQLPDLSEWRRINVRDPKLTGSLPPKIRESLLSRPEFVFLNRGMVLAVEGVEFDQTTSTLTLIMSNPDLHGLLDGGHTYEIITQNRDQIAEKGEKQYVKIEIVEGFDADGLVNLVDARNSSNQVKDESLMNLADKFDGIKEAIKGEPYEHKIAFSEYELDDNGVPKPIDIRDVVSLLMTMDRQNFGADSHPIVAYSSKAACLKHFRANPGAFDRLYPITKDILRLWDSIHLRLPDLYNAARKGPEVSGGKFGLLTGVAKVKRGVLTLDFTGQKSDYVIPTGFKYPILAAFRAILESSGKRYRWGADPFELLDDGLGRTLAKTIGEFALDAKNPSKTGKSQVVWQSCYQSAELIHLRSKRA